ncbi:LysE family translocator [Pseudomonas sp. UM16]|uniref:LysE family translocator n=1 Tax=Pseudomonas sp. UM16 TaxID=3158962 RepID=UPI00398FD035
MEQFLIVAATHFLALLSPGPDFFLVTRSAMSAGWRVATGACLGIALANSAFILAAFAGLSALQPHCTLFIVIQLAGCAYLLYIGSLFIRHAGSSSLHADDNRQPPTLQATWRQGLGMGLLSGLLNPKNALFYVSLASMVSQASLGWKLFYGLWMFSVVLAWDVLVAMAIGNLRIRRQFSRYLPWLERVAGAVLIALALAVIIHLLWR